MATNKNFDPIDYLKEKNHRKVVPSEELEIVSEIIDYTLEEIPSTIICEPMSAEQFSDWKRQAATRIRKIIWDELSIGKTIDESAHDWLQRFILGFAKHL